MFATTKKSSPPQPNREERIEAILQQPRPRIKQAVRQMVERAGDVPEAEEFSVAYTPDKKHHRYLVDFELDVLAESLRSPVSACGLKDVGQLVAITDGSVMIDSSWGTLLPDPARRW